MDFNALALECAPMVAPKTLAAIVRTESNFNPLAININKGYRLERQPKNKDEAVTTAQWLISNRYNIDMGLGQVNSANLAKTKLTVSDAFDPCKNLSAAATILKWNFESASKKIPGDQQALHAATSVQTTNLMAVQSQNQVAAGQSETAAAMKAQLLQEITTAQQNSKAIVVAPPKSAGEIEAQQRYDEHLNGQGPVHKAIITLNQGIRDPIGYLGVSTEHFRLNTEKSLATSEYDGLKHGVKYAVVQPLKIAAVGATAAVGGTVGAAAAMAAGGAGWAGLVALKFAENYGWTEAMKNAVMPTVEKLGQSYAHFQNQAGEAAINKFLEVANALPKDTRGNLTPESQQVL